MKHRWKMGLALMACGVVAAAEPPVVPSNAVQPAVVQPPVPTTTPTRKPLDLRVGDIRKYMMPNEFLATVRAPDADSDTVVVEGQREVVPMRRVEDVPMGLASLWYSVKDPKNAWRILAPTLNFKDGPTVDKVPPPVFRWGP